MEKIYIVGIGENGLDGLGAAGRKIVQGAELMIGDEYTLALVPENGSRRVVVGTNFDEAVAQVEAAKEQKIVVLAGGDPLFYGVARYLCDKLGKDRFEVVPHVSTMQLAFARVKESWEEAFLTNLAGHSLDSVLETVRGAEKVGLFTSDACGPSCVAQSLLDAKIDYFTGYVCENLGSPDERVTRGELHELAGGEFGRLNVMILVRKPHVPDRPSESIGRRLFGNRDEAFLQSKPKRGLLTPSEVRSMAMAELDVGPSSVVWDVGAGSGSVSIEAAQIAAGGSVYAIEVDPEDHELIVANAERFGIKNLTPILGRAPQAWADLPDPDCIFIGGTGRESCRLVEEACKRLKPGGRMVATTSSIDGVSNLHKLLHACGGEVGVWMINLARGNFQLERIRFESLNPTFMLSLIKAG
ncbi:MAG: precorrin-6y C5,15-methyltransferase (decarboxylating) subunit CbiE [Planctomycetota bacterium]|nr:precorrin-6y C5,15-methyltransferase (decarboxylating) subunit CbiE [Planctomycetota bacterium]